MNQEIYNQAITGCGIVDFSDHARLWATGRDRIDLIHRMSTNDLRQMAVNEGRATALTTAVGRMVDRIVVINLKERALLLGSAGTGELIRRWLAGYVFFNDDAQFTDATETLGQFAIFGPQAPAAAEKLAPGASALKPYSVIEREGVMIGPGEPLAGSSFFVVGDREMLADLWRAAVAAGAVEVDREVYEVIRIEAGLPEYGHEISEAFIPLEAGLWTDVSFSKGCYIGQEIIARMESRGKLAKTLVGVRAGRPLPASTASAASAARQAGGTLTSTAWSPRFGWIGLAYVRPEQAEINTELIIDGLQVTVASLPFRD